MGEKILPSGIDYTRRRLKIPEYDPGLVDQTELDRQAGLFPDSKGSDIVENRINQQVSMKLLQLKHGKL